ncbi:hypothetical protein [Flavobacterium sp.]|uniref:hypothetical protein n=1 Tax=Flavobacterium sp. TaxID=239 RepID=UPI001223D9EC|nr:hypothetical protein [Flavobacterium sp.]RZJ72252.1 MAG: hypothetical protein EOO49_07310 [Flavobacterium sp.]
MNEQLYSQSFSKRDKSYVFDIYKDEHDSVLLRISETLNTESGIEKRQIGISEEDLDLFVESLQISCKEFRKIKPSQPKANTRAEFLEKLREKHGQAFMPWSKEDDGQLEVLYCEGKSVPELARFFGRQNGAIRARIKKLELEEKYAK